MFKPVIPVAPNKSNRNPPTIAPTIPSAILSQKPWLCSLTILLPINPNQTKYYPADDAHAPASLLKDAILLLPRQEASDVRPKVSFPRVSDQSTQRRKMLDSNARGAGSTCPWMLLQRVPSAICSNPCPATICYQSSSDNGAFPLDALAADHSMAGFA
jgi:hypothetical protein